MDVTVKNGILRIDPEDWDYLKEMNWYIDTNGYVLTAIWMKFLKRNKQFKIEWFVLGKQKGYIIDHINGDKFDNRKANLRYVTYAQNSYNTRKRKNTLSKYKGVTYQSGKWRARITFNKKEISIGRFDTEIEAAAAYNRKALELYGEYAKINDI